MTAVRRWVIVGVGLLVLLATPFLVAAWPVSQSDDATATALLRRVRAAEDLAFTGDVEAQGHVALPDQQQLAGVGKLLGGRTEMRVWWADPETWRTATLRPTGETDLYHRPGGGRGQNLRWVYESKRVTTYPDPAVRLPLSTDLLPNVLAHYLLQGARPGELSRLPAERVAGRTAPGLRLTPAGRVSSIARADIYVDGATGLPVSVSVFGRSDAGDSGAAAVPALTTSFTDLSVGPPAASALAFTPPGDASVHADDVIDLASAADRYADLPAPHTLLGLPRRADGFSVGAYGRGPVLLLAIPVWNRYSDDLRQQLTQRPGVQRLPQGDLVTIGPLTLLLAPDRGGHAWLVAGTVTAQAATTAAAELDRPAPGVGGLNRPADASGSGSGSE